MWYLKISVILLLPFFLVSCFLLSEVPPPEEEELSYVPEIVWTMENEANYRPYEYPRVYGDYIYKILRNRNTDTQGWTTQVMKVHIPTGNEVWRTAKQQGSEASSPYKWNDYVFFHVQYDGPSDRKVQMLCFDDSTGQLLATIRLGATSTDERRNTSWNGNLVTAEKGLYWGSGRQSDNGLLYFDPDRINFTIPADTAQVIPPTLVYSTSVNGIWAQLVQADDVIFFLTHNQFGDSPIPATLFAWDSKTNSLLWKQEIPCTDGGTTNPLLIQGDRIYVIDSSSACFDKQTGELIFLRDMTIIDPRTTFNEGTGVYFVGPVFHYEGKLYYTNHMTKSTPDSSNIPLDLVYNLVCVDADDGHVVWKNRTPFSKGSSLFTNAIVANGKAYFVTDCGLRVYDAETGEFLGVDESIRNNGFERSIYHDGLMVFRNYADGKAVLTAIRI